MFAIDKITRELYGAALPLDAFDADKLLSMHAPHRLCPTQSQLLGIEFCRDDQPSQRRYRNQPQPIRPDHRGLIAKQQQQDRVDRQANGQPIFEHCFCVHDLAPLL
jgi:hypothetical protein